MIYVYKHSMYNVYLITVFDPCSHLYPGIQLSALHDSADIFLPLAKLFRYSGWEKACDATWVVGIRALLRFEKKTEFLDKSSETIDVLRYFSNRSEALVRIAAIYISFGLCFYFSFAWG